MERIHRHVRLVPECLTIPHHMLLFSKPFEFKFEDCHAVCWGLVLLSEPDDGKDWDTEKDPAWPRDLQPCRSSPWQERISPGTETPGFSCWLSLTPRVTSGRSCHLPAPSFLHLKMGDNSIGHLIDLFWESHEATEMKALKKRNESRSVLVVGPHGFEM